MSKQVLMDKNRLTRNIKRLVGMYARYDPQDTEERRMKMSKAWLKEFDAVPVDDILYVLKIVAHCIKTDNFPNMETRQDLDALIKKLEGKT